MNLIAKTFDAMPNSGVLTVTSRESNCNLLLSFADSDIGIPKENLDKLWVTLFTTKTKGMGLGLPICKRIVKAHSGCISVKSIINKGTTFTITIPINGTKQE